MKILGCASQGAGSDDELRLRGLLAHFDASFIDFDRRDKKRSFQTCLKALRKGDFDLFVLEGTGLAAGLAAILASIFFGRPYVLSSGDAVGPFLTASFPLGAPVFAAYERLLYRCSKGFIGWTPYLVGRALTLGARRGMTAPGWAPFPAEPGAMTQERFAVRQKLGIPQDALVFGIVGSLSWSSRYEYCYGSELVRAALQNGGDAYVLVVGDGSGLDVLRQMAGDRLGRNILLPGRVRRNEVSAYLAAMDVGSLPQSVDGVGSFRYTTKIAEYCAAGLPFVTNQIPMGYDLDEGDLWRLPGTSPWDPKFIASLSELMRSLSTAGDLTRAEPALKADLFTRDQQVRRVTSFLQDVISNLPAR